MGTRRSESLERADGLVIGLSPLCLLLLLSILLAGSGILAKLGNDTPNPVDASILGPVMIGQLHQQTIPATEAYVTENQSATTQPVPVLWRVPTTEPVVFLGIDDGWTKSPQAAQWLTSHKLPFTIFLTDQAAKDDYGYFTQLQNSGLNIQNHTLTHPDLTKLNYEQQKAEICGQSDRLQLLYGHRPTLFRPPYGNYNDITRQVVAECGMKAIIMWRAKADGGALQFQDVNHFEPGDIILMHFRPKFAEDMKAFMAEADRQHLSVGSLEDWVR